MSTQATLFDASSPEPNVTALAQRFDESSEEHLVSAAMAGDRGAFVELYDRHSKRRCCLIVTDKFKGRQRGRTAQEGSGVEKGNGQ